jgi:hypothetical protein
MNKHMGKKLLMWGAASTLLLLVFAAYFQPEVLMTLANQIWLCI